MSLAVRRFLGVAFLSGVSGIAGASAPARVDLLLVYTPAALQAAGSADAVAQAAKAMVKFANAAYARSDAGVFINLVGVRGVAYTESGDGSTDLKRMMTPGDGYLEEVPAWRDELGADVVGMIANGGGGVGNIPPAAGDAANAGFWIGWPQGGYNISTLAHELGHVLGAGHHWDNPWHGGTFAYSQGQLTAAPLLGYGDIMATGWPDVPPNYPASRSPYAGMSNPRLYIGGVPSGVPEGQARQADNARTLREMGPIVARYRPEKSGLSRSSVPVVKLDQAEVALAAPGLGASFSAMVDADVYPSLQWQASDNHGATWTSLLDTATVSGSTTANLSIGAVPASFHGRQFRLVAQNASGIAVSPAATLLLNVTLGAHSEGSDFLGSVEGWQTFVPRVNYIHAIDVLMNVTGSADTIAATLETADGKVVAETKVPVAADLPDTPLWVSLPFGAPVEQNGTYRLRLHLLAGNADTSGTRWIGSLADGHADGQSSFSASGDYSFRVYGAAAALTTTVLNLVPGWNLVGNSSSAAFDPASRFGEPQKVNAVWAWDAASAKWAVYLPSLAADALVRYASANGFEVLHSIDPGQGFWVNLRQPLAYGIPSAAPLSAAAFQNAPAGWQLLSVGSGVSPAELVAGLQASSAGTVAALWAWDAQASKWMYYAPALASQGPSVLSDFNQRNGYLDFPSSRAGIDAASGIWVLRQ